MVNWSLCINIPDNHQNHNRMKTSKKNHGMPATAFIFLIATLLFSCSGGGSKSSGEAAYQPQNLHEADSMIRHLDQLYDDDKITTAEYKLRMSELTGEAERMRAGEDNPDPALRLPQWALNLGLSMPNDMVLVPEYSHQTTAGDMGEGFNSVTLVFKGSYDTAMREATRIAREANVPVSSSWQKNDELNKKLGKPEIPGKTWTNYDLGMDQDEDYFVSIEVDQSGMLTISAADARGMKALIESRKLAPEDHEGN